jgi:phenylalanyl-tRNA synthetase beta chain
VEQLYAALKLQAAWERTDEPFLHPGKAARTREGWVGQLHPAALEGTWGVFELDLDALAAAAPAAVVFAEVSPYPEVRQDLAFVVDDEVPAATVGAAIREAGGDVLQSVEVFDEYRGAQIGQGRVSYAIALRFQPEAAGDEKGVERAMNRVRGALQHHLRAQVR